MRLVVNVTPDHAGFQEAQARLREYFGEPVVFLAAAEETWPPGTPLDPETGRPYDPTIEPVTTARAESTIDCNVAYRVGVAGDVDFSELGITESAHIMLIAGIEHRAAVEAAEDFVCREERFKITATRLDGIGEIQRVLIFGRRR